MADVFAPDYATKPLHMDDHGNAVSYDYAMESKQHSQNDKLYFGIIPGGTRVDEVRAIYEACGSSVTLDLGYEPLDGDTPNAALTAWFATTSIASAGAAFSTAFPITFNKPVKLVGTVKGANFGSAKIVGVVVKGQAIGIQ